MTSFVAPRINCEVIDPRDEDVVRIFNIQRYSLNDGQGIRTVVFFKGCPHTCPRCVDPESLSPRIETVRRESKYPHCTPCLRGADECPSGAFERIGRDITLDDLEREVMKDGIFFRSSGGGVTLSGGEVLMQAPFATRFLQRLRRWDVRCAIETAGDTPAGRSLSLAKECDEVLFDLKITDGDLAREIINMNLPRVLANLQLLVKEGVNVIPRLPLIPDFTMNSDNTQHVLTILSSLGIKQVHLLPFRQYGEPKYSLLGLPWLMKEVPVPTAQEVDIIRKMAECAGFQVTVGGWYDHRTCTISGCCHRVRKRRSSYLYDS